MRFRLTLILFFLNLAVFGLIFWLGQVPVLETEEEVSLLRDFSDDQSLIREIRLSGAEIERSRVFRQSSDGVWSIVEPLSWRANPFAIDQLLGELRFLDKEVAFPVAETRRSGQSLDDYGLEAPAFLLEIEGEAEILTFRIGVPSGPMGRAYLLTPDESEIWVIGRSLPQMLRTPLANFQTDNIFHLTLPEVRNVNLQMSEAGDVRVRLVRQDEGWLFESPIRTEADGNLVSNVLQGLLTLRTHRILRPDEVDPARTGLASPSMRITLEAGGGRTTLLLGEPARSLLTEADPDLYFARLQSNPTLFLVPVGPFLALRDAQESLRERRFLGLRDPFPRTIEIERGDDQLSLQQLEDGSWQVLDRSSGAIQRTAADPRLMGEFRTALFEVEALRFASDAPSEADLERFGLTDRATRIILRGGDYEEVLVLGNPVPGTLRVYARTLRDPFVYEISSRLNEAFSSDPLFFRNRILYRLPTGTKVQGVRFFDLQRDEHIYHFDREAIEVLGSQQIEELSGTDQAWATLLRMVREFRVDSYLDDEFSGVDMGRMDPFLWRYRMDLDLELHAGGESVLETLTFLLTERLRGNFQVGASIHYGVTFVLTPDFIDALHELLFARPLPLEYIAPTVEDEAVERGGNDAEREEDAAVPASFTETEDD